MQPLVDRLQRLLKARNVLHADETPVQQLAPRSPGATSLSRGRTQRAYLWAYGSGELEERVNALADPHRSALPAIVVFDYQLGRAGTHPRGVSRRLGGEPDGR